VGADCAFDAVAEAICEAGFADALEAGLASQPRQVTCHTMATPPYLQTICR